MPLTSMPAKIVVFGSLNMDFVVRVARLPAPGETALGSDFQMIPGGKEPIRLAQPGDLGAEALSLTWSAGWATIYLPIT